MKRFFFSVIALAAVTVSCTKSGILETPHTYDAPISFEPYTGRTPVTKATEAKEATIQNTGFHVTGFMQNAGGQISDPTKPYMNKDVIYEDSKWGYEGAAYWPESGELSFVAYGLNAGSAFQPTTTGSFTDFTFTVPDNVAEQKDLLISDIITDKSIDDNAPVQVTLKHVLSKVGFKVATNNDAPTTPSANDVKVTIKNITLNGVFKKVGTVDLTDGTAQITPGTDTKNSYSLFDSNYAKGSTGEDFNGFITGNTGATTPVTVYTNTTFDGDTQTYKYNNKNETVPLRTAQDQVTAEANRFMMLMPGKVGSLSTADIYDIDGDGDKTETTTTPYIEVIYQLTDAEEQVARVPLLVNTGTTADPVYENWEFKAGTAYEFVFKVSTTAVGFSVIVDTWKDSNGTANSADSEEFNLIPEII